MQGSTAVALLGAVLVVGVNLASGIAWLVHGIVITYVLRDNSLCFYNYQTSAKRMSAF